MANLILALILFPFAIGAVLVVAQIGFDMWKTSYTDLGDVGLFVIASGAAILLVVADLAAWAGLIW